MEWVDKVSKLASFPNLVQSRNAIAAFFVGLTCTVVFATNASAQVVVDDWSVPETVNVGPTVPIGQNPIAESDFVSGQATILGGSRHLIARRTEGDGQFTAQVTGAVLSHGASTHTAETYVIWDGRTQADLGNGSDPEDPDTIDFTGLGGENLTLGCPTDAQAISFLASVDNNAGATVTVDVYTNATDFSTGSAAIPQNTTAPISIPFSGAGGFSTGTGALNPADFTDVGAIRLSITTPIADDIDVTLASAVSNCGYDFGDAPETGGFIYTTTTGSKTAAGGDIQNNLETGPSHRVSGPFIGASATNDTDAEADGQPNAGANGDDILTSDDEAAITFPQMSQSGTPREADCDGLINDGDSNLYCVSVPVNNPTDIAAQLVGWLDFSGRGVFDDDGCGTSTNGLVTALEFIPGAPPVFIDDEGEGCERAAEAIYLGPNAPAGCGLPSGSSVGTPLQSAVTFGDGDWSTGNIPAGCDGTVVLVWDLSDFGAPPSNPAFQPVMTTDVTYARLRISTDAQSSLFANSGNGPLPSGNAEDGEVEDHRLDAGTVPVGIHAFESRSRNGNVEVSWSTVSESENIGFYIWGDNGRQFELLTPEMIPAKAGDLMTSRDYSVTLSSKAVQNVQDLVITAVDQNGKEEMYGMFSIGGAYGRDALAAPIDWTGIRAEAEQNLARLGLTIDGQTVQRNSFVAQPSAVDFQVQAEGMQRVSYQDLVAAGLDLRGVSPDQIAVTLNGQPVPRKVHSKIKSDQRGSSNRRAVSGGSSNAAPAAIDSGFAVDFWGERPQLPDAQYIEDYTYRISVDKSLARDVDAYTGRRLMQEASFHWRTIQVEEDNAYAMGSVLDDPWYMQRLRANHSTSSFATTITLPSDRFPNQPAWLEARVAGVTDFPQAPDHQVELYFNGDRVETVEFDGRAERAIRVELPAKMISTGPHQIEVRLPGGTDAPADLVYLDSVSLTYAATLRPANGRLLIDSIDPGRAFSVPGIDANDASAFAWDGERLVELPVEWATLGHAGVTPEADSAAQIWISNSDAIHRPAAVGGFADQALISGSPNLVVIAHPAFMPIDEYEAHPLNDYIAQRESQGWSVALVDVSDIQVRYSNGMPLPEAVTRFLGEASAEASFEHVLLVGGDSYDYHDRLGMGSLSFIPTVYGSTRYVPHSPSDALMSDVDGDGLGDLAIGRWPVRSMGDLESIVQKTLDWDANMVGQQTALWVADTEDPNIASFAGQVDRMLSPLRDAGWSDSGFDTIQVGAEQFDSADAARVQFFKLLQEGRALTGYSGHGSAGVWSFQGFLFPSDLSQLNNDGFPTLIGTMACYTSYFSSPSNDTVAHRWMNGFRLDRSGQPVPGAPNGAVAVHGAATLSNYAQNEVFASAVVAYQLNGMTLGEAVLAARAEARQRGINDLVVNWTLLGDPTVRLLDETGNRPEKKSR